MKNLLSFILVLLTLLFSHALYASSKKMTLSIFGNSVYRINPGMDAVLELAPDQQDKIMTAYDNFNNDEQVQSNRKELQQSEEADSAEANAARGAYYSVLKSARKKYDETLAQILNDEQKDLVKSLNRLGGEVEKESSYEGNKEERVAKFKELGTARLVEVLTPAQIQLLNAE